MTKPASRRTKVAKAVAQVVATRGQRVIAFIEQYCRVPEGKLVGQPIELDDFQKEFILAVYDNPHRTSRAILSMARKNGKTALIACLVLAHLIGPEAVLNSQIVSGATARDQAAIVFKLALKMLKLNPDLRGLWHVVPSTKTLFGLRRNVEYQALSADAHTNHGLSPVLAILDELGQVRGPKSDFVDAIDTAQGAHEDPLLIVISTQAPNDGDLLSIWIDDALKGEDPHTVVRLYDAPEDCELDDRKAWEAANPALDHFRSLEDVERQAKRALRMPSFENTFRNLVLNQRVDLASPFVTRSTWRLGAGPVNNDLFISGREVFVGLDLSARNDLTSMVATVFDDDRVLHARCWAWTPLDTLKDRAARDRAPYDLWHRDGWLRGTAGVSIDYRDVARDMMEDLAEMNIVAIGFDRWRMDVLKRDLDEIAFPYELTPFGQGFRDMAPAIDSVETLMLNGQLRHGNNPVLTMGIANSRVEMDPAGNRKLNKRKSTGRIDPAVALTIAVGLASRDNGEGAGDLDGFLGTPLTLTQ